MGGNKKSTELKKFKEGGRWLIQKLYEKGVVSDINDITKRMAPKMQNYIYNNNKNEFVMYVIRLCSGYSVPVPDVMQEILESENEEIFKERALAFLTGFISEKKEENNNNKKEEEDE